jgi:soluble lytic murein transglycosylase-like protein
MRRADRLRLATTALTVGLATAFAGLQPAAAASLQPLSPNDAQRYAAAFAASARGDFIDAQMQTVEIKDQALAGYLSFDQLMHPRAHKASFEELTGWLARFRDLPLADRIFGLAIKRKPSEASDPPAPVVAGIESRRTAPGAQALPDRARKAREAFNAGDPRRALALASSAGDRWVTGLAAYRLKAYDQAQGAFHELARDPGEDDWVRSAAAFWSARSAQLLGRSAEAVEDLQLAAQTPQTFYGMIAARQLRLAQAGGAAAHPTTVAWAGPALLSLAASAGPGSDVSAFVVSDPRAHRAAALAQVGRLQIAGEELRAGLALARTPTDREKWRALALALGAPLSGEAPAATAPLDDYPVPTLAPTAGFTIDKALVYAIVRQESRFDPLAVSAKGAVGLMQLTGDAAARAAGDDKLKADMRPLFDPALNLRVGQDYLTWLMDRAVGYDLLRVAAAYNGGPGMVQRTAQMLGDEAADPLLLVEALPAQETRAYVQKVLAGYWTYKTMFGEDAASLDALAGGARTVDARLDLIEPTGAATQLSGQLLQTGLR